MPRSGGRTEAMTLRDAGGGVCTPPEQELCPVVHGFSAPVVPRSSTGRPAHGSSLAAGSDGGRIRPPLVSKPFRRPGGSLGLVRRGSGQRFERLMKAVEQTTVLRTHGDRSGAVGPKSEPLGTSSGVRLDSDVRPQDPPAMRTSPPSSDVGYSPSPPTPAAATRPGR